MNSSSATIKISRHKSHANMFRKFTVLIDDMIAGKVKSGEIKQFSVPAGSHNIQVKIDFYKSGQVHLNLEPNQTVELECGENAPGSISEAFSIKGVEQNINAFLKPDQYLFLNLLGENQDQIMHQQPTNHTPQPNSHQQSKKSQAIFISYRRSDSREITGRICDRLMGKFGREMVFRDVDSIPAGKDFRTHISSTISECNVVVAIIGKEWLNATNRDGEMRLGLPDDPLTAEIETALEHDVPVIPVLVKGADMPDPHDLPENLKPIAYNNAVIIPREPYFHAGVDRLIDELEASGSTEKKSGHQFCFHCGNQIDPSNKFCTHCGKPV